jgi:phycoerythrocyanin-associated rod linker protein
MTYLLMTKINLFCKDTKKMSLATSERLGISSALDQKVELRRNWTEDDLQLVFRAAYQQVFGREGVYVGTEFVSAESMLRNGQINVRQFVAILAKSDL